MRNLAIARAGDDSRHVTWLSRAEKKNFDLLVAYYGDHPGKWKETSDIYDHAKGLKYPWFDGFLRSNPWIFEYDAVWLADDDLEAETAAVADAFDIFHDAGLCLGQPALTFYSPISHDMMRRKSGSLLRYVGFVEEQMPMFSRESLRRLQRTLGESQSGWGLGIAWAQILGHPKDRMAVIDAAPMKHVRPLGTGEMYTRVLPALRADPLKELDRMREKYLDDLRMEVFGGVSLDPSHPLTPERLARQGT